MSDYPTIRNYQIRSRKIVIYNQYQGYTHHQGYSIKRSDNLKTQRKKAYSGELTKSGKKRMEKAITLMCQASPKHLIWNPVINKRHWHKLSFVTLTISDSSTNYTAKEAYKTCLRPLLQWLTKYKGVKLYVWKAELQKRGQIHYHLATPTFINCQELKNKWNYLQFKAGYLEGYFEKYGSHDPNSTDIHSMRKVENAAAYLTKYFAKTEVKKDEKENEGDSGRTKTKGKTWDCSMNLKKTKYFTCEESSQLDANIKSAVIEKRAVLVNHDYFSILQMAKGSVTDLLPLSDLIRMKSYLYEIKSRAA